MAFLDFLTEGSPVEAIPVSSTQQTILPDWYTNYAMDILANQKAIAARPFQEYVDASGNVIPRVADFAPDQQAGFAATRTGATAYQPYLQQASRSAADVTGQYMNPYTEQVVNRIGQLGTRTLKEQVLPGIESEMIRAGQFGGSRQAEITGRAIRDAMEGISAQQSGALERGYAQSLEAAQAEQQRQGALATQAQQLGLTGAGALQQVGAQQQDLAQKNLDLAYQDFLKRQQYPQEQVTAMQGALGAVQPAVPQAATKVGTEVPGAFSPSLLSQMGQAYATYAGMTS